MRLEDVRDYWKLRRMSHDAWRVVRFRKRQRPGQRLRVALRSGASLELRGGLQDHHIFHRIFLRDEYRLEGNEPRGCVVDLGANVGLFSARVASRAQRVIACEPVAENYRQLLHNVAAFPNVEPLCVAVSGDVGRAPLYRPRSPGKSGGYSLLPASDRELSGEVETRSLAALFEQCGVSRCALLKLDVEGAEYEILYRAPDDVLLRVDRICAELHASGERDCSASALGRYLEERSFSVDFHRKRGPQGSGLLFAQRGPAGGNGP